MNIRGLFWYGAILLTSFYIAAFFIVNIPQQMFSNVAITIVTYAILLIVFGALGKKLTA